jgi:polyhydroxybutyrate depolymerase
VVLVLVLAVSACSAVTVPTPAPTPTSRTPTATTAPTTTPTVRPTLAATPLPSEAPNPSPTPRPPFKELPGAADSSGCARSLGATGDSSVEVEVDGATRSAVLHVPEGLTDGQSVPLVLVLHGTFMRGEEMAGLTGYSDLADERGFFVAYPDPTDDYPGWNAVEASDTINDVAFLSGLLDYLVTTYCVDMRRIFAAGFSAGGTMAHTAACRDARIASIALVSSGFAVDEPICERVSGIPTIEIQGLLDPLIPWFGGRIPLPEFEEAPPVRPVPDWTANIAAQNGCPGDSWQLTQVGDWVVPFEWPGCEAATVLYRVGNGGHNWPGGTGLDIFGNINRDINASELSYDFFLDNAKPPAARVYENATAGYRVTLPESWTGGVWVGRYGYHTELAGSVTFPVGKPLTLDVYPLQFVLSSGALREGVPTPAGHLTGRSAKALARSLIEKVPGYSLTDYTLDADGEAVVVISGTGLPMAGLFTHGDRAFLLFAYREVPLGGAGSLSTFLDLFEFTDERDE